MDAEIQQVLESGETIKWEGKVNSSAMLFVNGIAIVIASLIAWFLFSLGEIPYTSESGDAGVIQGWWIGAGVLGIVLLPSLLGYFSMKAKRYAITEKRVIIKSGLIGTDFASVPYDQMEQVLVEVGIVGKIFHCGSVKIDTGKTETYSSGSSSRRDGTGIKVGGISIGGGSGGSNIRTRTVYQTLQYVPAPYDVYKMLQESLSSRKENLYSGKAGDNSSS